MNICTIPLMVRESNTMFDVFDAIAVTVFSIDYILRLITADYYFKDHRLRSFLKYPVSPLAIIDLLSILPFFAYILIISIIMFQIEPDTFGNSLNAFYWATASLTTIGYGDITAVSTAGRLFTILSDFVGIAVIALPTGVVTAGYLEEIRILDKKKP